MFLNGPIPASFFFIFVLFKHKFYRKKTEGFSRIQTRIVRVECKHADHLTTTTAPLSKMKLSSVALEVANQLFLFQALQHALQQQQQNIQQHLQNLLLLQSAGSLNMAAPTSPILGNQVSNFSMFCL